MSPWLEVVLRAAAVLVAFLTLPLLVGQTEHKVMGHMQGRLGPMYAGGFHGWAQLVADGVKFVQKEDVTPARADRRVFRLAPFVALIPYLVALAVIPITPKVVGADVEASVVLVLAVIGVGIIGTLMAGWASANKYALLGGLRAAAQLVSYELPMVLAVASVALAAGTLSLIGIGEAWSPWWLLWQAPGAVVFLVAALAELQRPPFDMPVADSEIVFGVFTEYTGLRFAFFLLAEYAGIVVMSLLFSVLYLGGWHGPWQEAARLAVDPAQGLRGRRRGDLAAGLLAPDARGPAPAPRLGLARPDRPRPARDHGSGSGDDPMSTHPVTTTDRTAAERGWARRPAARPRQGARHDGTVADTAHPHGRVPRRRARAAVPLARGHRADRGELHLVHALRARVPRLVHLHRLPQGGGPGHDAGRTGPPAQRARPLRDRLLAVHVLRDLRRRVPLRRAALEPRVRVRRARHP